MSKPAGELPHLTAASGLERYMPMPPVFTSTELFPEWTSMRACLYRLSPGEVTLPASDSLRVVVQLSTKCMTLERDLGGVVSAAHPCLDAVNINPAYQPIHWQWDSFMEIVQMQLSQSFLAKIATEHGLDMQRLLQLEKLNIHDSLIAQIGHEVAAILDGRHPETDTDYLDTLAGFLCLHLSRRYCVGDVTEKDREDQHTQDFGRVIEFIHQNLEKDLRLEQIARVMNLSNFYFIRQFKAAFGVTPHQYILDCRVGLAKELLRDTFLPISVVSQRCGFSTQSHFTSAFRQTVGASPRVYRQQQAKPDQPAH